MGDWMPCGGGSRQHFVKSSGQVVVVVAGPHQLAEGEALQLTELGPLLEGDCHGSSPCGLLHIWRQMVLALPGRIRHRGQILGHAIRHRARAVLEMVPQLVHRLRRVRPVHKGLALGKRQFQPMAQLQLQTDQIEFAANAEGNAAPGANEIPLKEETMAGGLRRLGGIAHQSNRRLNKLNGVNDDNGAEQNHRCSFFIGFCSVRFAISLGLLLGLSHGWVVSTPSPTGMLQTINPIRTVKSATTFTPFGSGSHQEFPY